MRGCFIFTACFQLCPWMMCVCVCELLSGRNYVCVVCLCILYYKREQCRVSTQSGVEKEMTAPQQASCVVLPLNHQLFPITERVRFRFPINRLRNDRHFHSLQHECVRYCKLHIHTLNTRDQVVCGGVFLPGLFFPLFSSQKHERERAYLECSEQRTRIEEFSIREKEIAKVT